MAKPKSRRVNFRSSNHIGKSDPAAAQSTTLVAANPPSEMADPAPPVSSDVLSNPHPACSLGCAGGSYLECDGCQAAHLIRNLNTDISYIKSSLQDLSRFEEELHRHMEPLVERVEKGKMTQDQVYAFLAEPRFVELIRAVKLFKLQLPFTSYFDFSETQDQNPSSTSTSSDIDSDSNSAAPISELETKYANLNAKKDCLCYCSVFDGEIKKRELINWWIGANLLDHPDSSPSVKNLEQIGEDLLQQLDEEQFITRVQKKNRPSDAWRMKPSVQNLIRSKAKDAGLFDFDQKTLSAEVMLLRSDNRIGALLGSFTPDKVKAVFNVNRDRIGKSEAMTLASMKNLAVLHLGGSQPKQYIHQKDLKLIMQRLKKMKQLRLLSLQGMKWMTKLSDSVSTLTSLVVLDLRACHALEKLPSSIGNLKNLTRLDMSGCYILLPLPKGVRSLSNLEVLKGFVIGKDVSTKGSKNCSLHDLRLLTKLYKLSIFVWRENFPQSQDLKHLAKIEGLVKLKIQWIQDRETSRLNQNGQGQEIPDNVDRGNPEPATNIQGEENTQVLKKLEKLDLWYAPNDAGRMLLDPKKFIALTTLYIRRAKFQLLSYNHNAEEEEDKWKAKTLRLLFLPNLKMSWEDLNTLFPRMSYLEVQDCPELQFSEYLDKEGVWKHQTP